MVKSVKPPKIGPPSKLEIYTIVSSNELNKIYFHLLYLSLRKQRPAAQVVDIQVNYAALPHCSVFSTAQSGFVPPSDYKISLCLIAHL
jgi:hypothetical protein